jgi:hypothetical protein
MKTLECPTCFSELQFTQVYEIESDNYLRLLDYDPDRSRWEIEGAI